MRPWLRRIWIAAGVSAFAALWYGFQADLPAGEDQLRFSPGRNRGVSVLFFPGGMVEPRAYSPLAKRLAASGYETVIQPLPGDRR